MNKTRAFASIVAIAGMMSLTACGTPSSGPSTANGQTADSVLTADGYTPAITLTTDEINCAFGSTAQYITDGAAGFSSSGNGNVEMVILFSDLGMTIVNPDGNLPASVEAEIPGSTVTANGDALIIDMSSSTFTNLPSNSNTC